MSTAGKVLVVLTTLMLLVWLFMFSAVDQLHRNWGQEVKKQQDSVAKLTAEHAKLAADLDKNKADIDRIQVKMDQDVTVLRRRLSAVQAVESEIQEALTRSKFELAKVRA